MITHKIAPDSSWLLILDRVSDRTRIVFLANLGIGYNTPPVGLNLFIASSRFDRPIVELYKATLPFLLLLLITLLLITFWPALSLFLPGLLGS